MAFWVSAQVLGSIAYVRISEEPLFGHEQIFAGRMEGEEHGSVPVGEGTACDLRQRTRRLIDGEGGDVLSSLQGRL